MVTHRAVPVALALLLAGVVATAQDEKKLPEPEKESLAGAEKTIRELFKADYLKTRAVEKRSLAIKLFDQALETKDDPASRFVLYREASALAAQAGEFGIALAALDRLGKEFETEAAPVKVAALKTAAASTSATKQKNLAETVLGIYYEVIGENDPKVAADLLAIAEAAAQKANSSPLVAKVQSRKLELADISKEFDKYRAALLKVEMKSEDPDANLVVGKYVCFIKGDWPMGLPHMAKSGDETLKTLATRDVGKPGDADSKVHLADGWWDMAETLNPAAKRQVAIRAAYWYAEALPNLTGLTLTKAKERIAVTHKQYPQPETIANRDHIPVPLRAKLRRLSAMKATPAASANQFVGRWQLVNDKGVVSSYLTITSSFSAKRDHAPNSPGQWEIVGKEARITWEDGYRDIFRLEDGNRTFLGLGKATSWDSPAIFRLQAVRIPTAQKK